MIYTKVCKRRNGGEGGRGREGGEEEGGERGGRGGGGRGGGGRGGGWGGGGRGGGGRGEYQVEEEEGKRKDSIRGLTSAITVQLV